MKVHTAVLAAFLFFASFACHAQLGGVAPPEVKKVDGPSLEDTTKWISEKMSAVATNDCNIGWDRGCSYQVSFEGCTATLVRRKEGDIWQGTVVFPLADVEVKAVIESKVEMKTRTLVPRYYLSIEGLGSREVVRSYGGQGQVCTDKITGPTCKGPMMWSGLLYKPNFDSFEMADRMATAFGHAQQLCRQRAAEEQAKKMQQDAARNAKKPADLF